MILESLVLFGAAASLYTVNRKTDKKKIVERWYKLMEGCRAENKEEDKKTFLIHSIIKEDWGFNLMIVIPPGKTFEELEKIKPIIEVGYPCNCEIARNKLSKLTNVKLILKDFSKEKFKPIKLDPNKVLLGYDLMDKPIIVDFNNFPHALIAGMPGMGKSRLLLIILTNLIYSYDNNLEIYLCALSKNDHKMFTGFPGVKGYFHDISEIRKVYADLNKLREKREEIFDKSGCINIYEYNQKSKVKMNYIYISADEFSLYMPDDSDSRQVEEDKKIALALLKIIIKESRSAGIFVILGIQVTTYEEMPTIIRRCCGVKVSFKQSDKISSNAILGCADATELEAREFIIYTDKYKRCKTPEIDRNIINQYISMPVLEKAPQRSIASAELQINSIHNLDIKPKFKKYCEQIIKKAEDNTNYGRLEAGRKKGVLKDVNATG